MIRTRGDGGLNRLVVVVVGEGVRLECFERICGKNNGGDEGRKKRRVLGE